VRKADNLPPSCAVVTKSGNLNFLEPSGSVQACNGTALPLLLRQFAQFVEDTRPIQLQNSGSVMASAEIRNYFAERQIHGRDVTFRQI